MASMKGSVFRTWLVSYAVTLLVPTAIAGLVYFRTVSFVRSEVESANRIVLNQIRDDVDRQFEDLQRFSMQIALNERVQALMYSSPPIDEYHRLRINTLMRDLRFYSIASGVMDGMILYFMEPDFFLTSEAYRTPEEFFAIEGSAYRNLEQKIAEWMSAPRQGFITLLDSAPTHSTGPQSNRTQPENQADINTAVPVFIQSFPITSRTPSALIIFRLDLEECLTSLRLVSMLNAGYFTIGNERDVIYFSSAVQADPTTGRNRRVLPVQRIDERVNRSQKDHSGMIRYVAESEVTSLRYSFYIPETIFWQRARYIRNFTLFSLVVSILLCSVVAYAFAKRNYSPVETLVALFRSRKTEPLPTHDGTNELEYIRDEITHALVKNREYRARIGQQKGIIRTRRLTELLRGRIRFNGETLKELHSLGLTLTPERYGVYCFSCDEPGPSVSGNGRENEKKSVAERLSLIEFSIIHAVESAASDEIDAYYTEVNGISTVLIHINPADHPGRILGQVAETGKARIEEALGCTLTVGLSRVHRSVSELPIAYHEASEALEYRLVAGTDRIIPYDELETRKFTYHYSLKDEERLLNSIKTGDFESTATAIDSVLATNTEGRQLSTDSARCLMFDLTGTMVKALNHFDPATVDALLHELRPVHTITHAETLQHMRERMIDLLQRVCAEVERQKHSHNTELRDQVAAFLEEHIDDPALTIHDVATAFEMDAGYISRFFKEQTGMTIPACLQARRFDEAKRLLRDSDLTVKEISGRVGYFSSAVFIRAFKREEGVTPGQYKKAAGTRLSNN